MIKHDPAKTARPDPWRKAWLIIVGFMGWGFIATTSAQSTNINGVVNSYFQVIEIIPAKACVRVSNPTGLVVNTRVMLIQMKGASINTSNNISFGDTTSLGTAGHYEIGTICFLDGDSVFLFHELLNNYNYNSGKVQLVQFAEYYTAVVTDTVKAAPWNNSTGTGGVIAIFCDQDLTLNAPIYADSLGFQGGSATLQTNCSNFFPSNAYYYNAASTGSVTYGAYKGESVTELTAAMSGGRGAPANGGGGGNNHNNGGGGGANLSAGGMGGGNSSTTGCTGDYHALAGRALSSWNGIKIFPGGGGGAGHTNEGLGGLDGGGNGGGIVFILANNFNSNGFKVSANGGKGANAISDGAAGGGAGGTIIMNILNSYTGSLIFEAKGGAGGDENNGGNAGRCYGAGGGGSGGVIYFNGATPAGTVSVTGGAAGQETQRDLGCSAAVLPTAGSIGSIIPNYTYSTSTDPAGYCEYLLPVQLEYFKASLINRTARLQWKLLNPADVRTMIIERSVNGYEWSHLTSVDASSQSFLYAAEDDHPFIGKTYYRIRFIENNNSSSYSPTRLVSLELLNPFIVYPNPATDKIEVRTKTLSALLVNIFDVSGKLVISTSVQLPYASISCASLANGIYIIEVNGSRQKLIIY